MAENHMCLGFLSERKFFAGLPNSHHAQMFTQHSKKSVQWPLVKPDSPSFYIKKNVFNALNLRTQ